ncbi:MAG TPA: hypothetical protein VJB60_01905 [Candidatus Peribacterales bacterium]|nr:hypothetical protein [Candidatus Peribacterales bacterium]
MRKKGVTLRSLPTIEDHEEFADAAERYFERRYFRPGPEYMGKIHQRINRIPGTSRDLRERMERLLDKLH